MRGKRGPVRLESQAVTATALAWVDVLGGIPNRRADLKQDFSDLVQEGLERATAGQVQFDTVLSIGPPVRRV